MTVCWLFASIDSTVRSEPLFDVRPQHDGSVIWGQRLSISQNQDGTLPVAGFRVAKALQQP